MDAAAIPWWIWPIALFLVSFAIGIVAVLAGVGGGVLFVPIVGIAILIWRTRAADRAEVEADALGAFLRLEGEFVDPAAGMKIDWRTHRTLLGLAAFAAIGFVGGIFGLGAGFANVPALNLLMAAPLKVAVGSSGLLISVINSSAAWVYLHRGALLPLVVVPSILGVMLGSRLGARLLHVTPAPVIRRLVIVVMLLAGARALSRGLGLWA